MKKAVRLVILTGTLLTTSLFAQMTWTQATASAGWHPRDGAGSVVFNGKVWVMGGDSLTLMGQSFAMLNDVWYSPDGTHWTQATGSAGWSGRMSTPLVFGGKMWILGGMSDSGLQNDVWYSLDGAQWTQATASAEWSKRVGNAALVFNGMMWVMGGTDQMDTNGPVSFKNDVWYSTDGAHWTLATDSTDWSPRMLSNALVFNGMMWVMGGCDSMREHEGPTPLNDVWHSTDGVHWTLATGSAEWPQRLMQSSLVFDNKMWVLGGMADLQVGDVWYSTDGASWTEAAADAPWHARYGHVVADFNSNMWVMGGANDLSTLNDVWYSAGLGVVEDRASPQPGMADLNVQPNPFQNETRLAYSPTEARPMKVSVQDISGRQVRLLVNGIEKPGLHTVVWDGRDRAGENVSAGIYFALLSAGGHTVEKKLVKLE
jgi:hypothetical protein